MGDLELIFSMLGEASTNEIIKSKKPKGFIENKIVAKQGGTIAGNARKALEQEIRQKVGSAKNHLPEGKKNKELKKAVNQESA